MWSSGALGSGVVRQVCMGLSSYVVLSWVELSWIELNRNQLNQINRFILI